MARVALLSAAILLANLGADGSQSGLCGHDMEIVPESDPSTDAPDGGMTDDGGTPDGGAMSGSGKSPHLINTVTGEDLGLLVDLQTLTVFSEKFNALIELGTTRPTSGVKIYFSAADCNGTRYIAPVPHAPPQVTNLVYMIGPQSTYLQPTGDALRDLFIGSELRNAGGTLDGMLECANIGMVRMGEFTKYVDTKIKRRPPDNQLKVELR